MGLVHGPPRLRSRCCEDGDAISVATVTSIDLRDPPVSARRVVAARVVAWVWAFVAAVPLFGLVDLGTLFGLSDSRYRWAMSLEASWGSLLTFFLAVGFAWVAIVPARPWPGFGLLVLATGSLVAAGVAFLDVGPLWLGPGFAAGAALVWAVLRPERPYVQRGRPSVLAAVLGAVGVPLWLAYAALTYAAARTAGAGEGDETMGVDHWPVQAALGLALAVGSAVLALVPARLTLWRWAFALTAGFVSYAALVFPDRAGAMPHVLWAVGIALWGVAVALAPRPRR